MSNMAGVVRGLTQDVREDIDARNSAGGSGSFGWFKLARHGDSALVRFLFADDQDKNLIAVYEHALKRQTAPFNVTCIGKKDGCPLCEKGERNSLKAYFLLWNYAEAEKKANGDENARPIQVWKRGTRDINNILGLIAEYGKLNERDFKIQRQGSTVQNTAYQFFPKDRSDFAHQEDVAEALEPVVEGVLKLVAPKSVEDILTLAAGGSLKSEDDDKVQGVQKPADGYDPNNPDQIPF